MPNFDQFLNNNYKLYTNIFQNDFIYIYLVNLWCNTSSNWPFINQLGLYIISLILLSLIFTVFTLICTLHQTKLITNNTVSYNKVTKLWSLKNSAHKRSIVVLKTQRQLIINWVQNNTTKFKTLTHSKSWNRVFSPIILLCISGSLNQSCIQHFLMYSHVHELLLRLLSIQV